MDSCSPPLASAAFFWMLEQHSFGYHTGKSTVPPQINREASVESPALQEESELRDGTHEDTLATPSDFPVTATGQRIPSTGNSRPSTA